MKPSAKNSSWLKKLQEEGKIKKSKTLEERPTLFSNILWAWEAFDILNRQRGVSETGPLPISISDLYAYCELARILPDDRDFLLTAIPELDTIFLNDFHETSAKRADAQKRNSNKGKRR